MNIFLLLLAVVPTVATIFQLSQVIASAKQFNRKTGMISDLNLFPGTKNYLFVAFAFWIVCQTAYLFFLSSRLQLLTDTTVIMLAGALVAGLIGLPFPSRSFAHTFLITSSIVLSFMIMIRISIYVFGIHSLFAAYLSIILLIMTISAIRLAGGLLTNNTTHYWKIEFVILMLYGLWNTLVYFAQPV